MNALRDSAVRVALGIPLGIAASLAGVSRPTLTKYELDPHAVHDPIKRESCAKLYGELRTLLSREWLARPEAA